MSSIKSLAKYFSNASKSLCKGYLNKLLVANVGIIMSCWNIDKLAFG